MTRSVSLSSLADWPLLRATPRVCWERLPIHAALRKREARNGEGAWPKPTMAPPIKLKPAKRTLWEEFALADESDISSGATAAQMTEHLNMMMHFFASSQRRGAINVWAQQNVFFFFTALEGNILSDSLAPGVISRARGRYNLFLITST